MCKSFQNFFGAFILIIFGLAIFCNTLFNTKLNLWPYGVAVFLIWKGIAILSCNRSFKETFQDRCCKR